MERIKNAEGEWNETTTGVHQMIQEYFTNIFTASNLDGKLSEHEQVNQISAEQNAELIVEIMKKEVKDAVFSMHPDKASGPDSFNPGFYQAFWEVVQDDVVNFYRMFMDIGE